MATVHPEPLTVEPLACPYCDRRLYPHLARWTADGWACANRVGCRRRTDSASLQDEIAWLRSFGWPADRIATRLGVTTSCVEKRLAAEAQS